MITRQKYPKTCELLDQWLKNQVTKTLPAGMPQLTDALPGEAITEMVIKTNGRTMYEFYDSYDLYPGITKAKMGWKWRIDGNTIPMEGNAANRIEAEEKAFEECAKRLENL